MSRLSPLTGLEISRLPKPDLVETLSFERELAELKADFLARWAVRRAADPDLAEIDAETLDLESEPIAVLLETAAFRHTLLRARVNDAGRATMLAYSGGADLDHIAADLGVARLVVTPADGDQPAVLEADERLRRRVRLAPSAFGTAGALDAYVFYALTAAPTIADASALKTGPGEILVTLLGAVLAQPSPAELAAVRAAFAREDVCPATDVVAVEGPLAKTPAIAAWLSLYPGPAVAPIVAAARASLDAFLARNRRLGADLTRSAIMAALHVEGVQSVRLDSPAADVDATRRNVVTPSVAVSFEARDE